MRNEKTIFQKQGQNNSFQAFKEAIKVLNEIKGSDDQNPYLAYFYNRLYDFSDQENKELQDKTVIATMCNFVPEEIIYALGAFPLRLCSGHNIFDQAGAEFLPSKGCPLVKACAGRIYYNNYPLGARPKLIINPASCDQKKKLAEVLNDSDTPFYLLDIPIVKDNNNSLNHWIHNIIDLISTLENITGKKLSKKSLKNSISMVFNAQSEFRRLYRLNKTRKSVSGLEFLLISNVYFFDDIQEWTRHLKQLNDHIEANKVAVSSQNKKPRIMLTGSPSIFPNIKIPYLVEKLGGRIVADDFCSSQRLLYDMAAVDEWHLYDMIPAMATRSYKPSTCPNLYPSDDKKRNLLNIIKENDVEGVLFQSFTGCHLFEMESLVISKMLQKEGIPMLYIETDYNPDDHGQLTTRIEAFLESIQSLT